MSQIPLDATVKVLLFERPQNGLLAEVDVSKPHVRVPHDDAVIDVSTALAWKLIVAERAEIVEPDSEELEDYEREPVPDPVPPSPVLTSAPVQKAEFVPLSTEVQLHKTGEDVAESNLGGEKPDPVRD